MRLYKGEGQATLIAYYPFALATFSPLVMNSSVGAINNMLDKTIEGKMSVGLYTTKKDINELEERKREITNEIICS